MAPTKPKTTKKKKATRNKLSADNIWLDFNFPPGTIDDGMEPHMVLTRAQIQANCTATLNTANTNFGTNFRITDFKWSVVSGLPKITKLKVYVTPKPTRASGTSVGSSTIKPPQPPPPPPPYLG